MKKTFQALVLAAGKSSRFNTNNSKLIYPICGLEMILYPLKTLQQLDVKTTLIVGYQKEKIIQTVNKHIPTIEYVEQKEQLGTGHAVKQSIDVLTEEHIIILNGDMPLINENIISEVMEEHIATNATISFVISYCIDKNINGYGRLISKNNSVKIVEQVDFNSDIESHPFVNAGIYIIKKDFLQKAVTLIEQQKNTKEFYITDLINIADKQKEKILTIEVPFDYVRGINTIEELCFVEDLMQIEIVKNWMQRGVRFISPQTVYIDYNVSIGNDTVISSGVHLKNNTEIANNCYIDSYCILNNAKVKESSKILPFSVISDSTIYSNTQIGPFAHIKKNTDILENSVIGNFVEISKSQVCKNSKIKHLSYIGDAKIGNYVNIGAGTITCNFDGKNKYTTHIKDNTFIGSNSSLIAPITIEKNSIVAAGSVITKDVPTDSLAIARSYQTNKENYTLRPENKFLKAIKTEYIVKENL